VSRSNTVAVTGASRGIGSAIARELAGRGFRVACLSRKGVGVEDAEIDAAIADRLTAIPYEATDESSIREALGAAATADGLLGIVNNAGIHWTKPAETTAAADFQEMMRVNALGTFLACREAYPHLKEDGGIIVNIGSYYDRLGVRDSAAYAASKAAVGAITRCLAIEWARDNIRVHNVAPGFVATDMNREFRNDDRFMDYVKHAVPVGKLGQPEEIARVVAAIFSEGIDFLTGETIYVDGGHGIGL
jgi:NAD(P)-dependent dehydrogenase (short-subunit alcohol dehydrogenase family)